MDTLKNLKTVKAVTAIALAVLFFACAQDDELGRDAQLRVSTINVTAQDFASDNPETRASERGYVTTFTNGDKIGITVISDGNIVAGQDNIPYILHLTGGWVPDGEATITYVADATYLAYYPYSAAMNGKTTMAQILAAFTPKGNQSDYNDYTTSDLMTGTGLIYGSTLNIYLSHVLALIEVSLPATATAVTLKTGTTAVTPFKNGDSYRYIAKPQAGVTLSGGYTYIGKTWAWQKTDVTLTAGKYTKAGVKRTVTPDLLGISLASIPRGTFTMGSPYDEEKRESNEMQHDVTLTKDFYMSRYEITNAQYAVFLNANIIGSDGEGRLTSDGTQTYISGSSWGLRWNSDKWEPVSGKENFPVINVTWYGAKVFAEWVGGSLPTEAQWEYACRAGTSTAYSYGASADGGYMWYNVNSGGATHAVGTTSGGPNAWGLYDMHGNVGEWCADKLGDYDISETEDPIGPGPSAANNRVWRGGCWVDNAPGCRSAYRNGRSPYTSTTTIGFRVVLVP